MEVTGRVWVSSERKWSHDVVGDSYLQRRTEEIAIVRLSAVPPRPSRALTSFTPCVVHFIERHVSGDHWKGR